MRRVSRFLAFGAIVGLIAAGCAETSASERDAIAAARGDAPVEDGPFVLPDPDTIELDPDVDVIERTGERPEVSRSTCPFDREDLADAVCGTVVLPGRGLDADYEVSIAFARFSSSGDADDIRSDPVVYLHGGPGGAILDEIDVWYESIVAPFIGARDVILYDQRGGGRSTTTPRCHEVSTSGEQFHSTATPHDELAADFLAGLATCATKFDDVTTDPSAFSSRINAQDLVDLMWALGVQQYNLYGSSYGTRLAQTVLRDEPAGVRSVILSGAYPVDVNLMGSIPVSIESALDAVFTGCANDQTCSAALPDGWQALEDLVAELDANPLPVDLAYTLDEVQPTLFDGTDLLNGLHSQLYVGADAADIPDLLIDHADGNIERLERLARNSVFDYVDTATFLLVQCADEAPFTTADELARPLEHEFLRAVDLAPSINGIDSLTICDEWTTDVALPWENDAVTWDVPTLIFAGGTDPITPPAWAEILADRLPRARLVQRADMGHDADEGWCATTLMTAFVDNPDLLLDTSCAATPTHLPMPNLAERFRGPWQLVDASLDLDGDDEYLDLQLPDWWGDWREDAHIRWRDLDIWDLTAVIVRNPGSTYDLTTHLNYEWVDAEWQEIPNGVTPPGWVREVIASTAGDLIRYRNTTTGVDVTLHLQVGADPGLEVDILAPVARSIGDNA